MRARIQVTMSVNSDIRYAVGFLAGKSSSAASRARESKHRPEAALVGEVEEYPGRKIREQGEEEGAHANGWNA